jgi:hypothetical protein
MPPPFKIFSRNTKQHFYRNLTGKNLAIKPYQTARNSEGWESRLCFYLRREEWIFQG